MLKNKFMLIILVTGCNLPKSFLELETVDKINFSGRNLARMWFQVAMMFFKDVLNLFIFNI